MRPPMPPRQLAALLSVLGCAVSAPLKPASRRYAVIFDAGSTGTRVHVFSWAHGADGQLVRGLPDVLAEPGGSMKVKPGISSFDGEPEAAGSSIVPLIELAERVVPPSEHAHALVMLRATAGMRLISRRRAQRIYTSLYDAIARRTTFQPRRQDFGTLSGDDEGLFGWLCANYLLVRAGKISEMGSVGALDLGGGSTQITMAMPRHAGIPIHSEIDPRHGSEIVEHAGKGAAGAVMQLLGRRVAVFTHSHLGFGNKVILSSLTAEEAAACLAANDNSSWEPCNNSEDYDSWLKNGARPIQLRGRGDFAACDAAVRRALRKFDRAGQPPVVQGAPVRFVAMSLFFYVRHFASAASVLPKHEEGGTTVASLRHAARILCDYDERQLRRLVGVDPLTTDDALRWRCFDLTYTSRLLSDGYGFSEDATAIDFLGDVDGVEVEWTLGALLQQLLRDAHSDPRTASGAAGAAGHGRPEATSPVVQVGVVVFVCGLLVVMLRRWLQGRGIHGRATRPRLLSKW